MCAFSLPHLQWYVYYWLCLSLIADLRIFCKRKYLFRLVAFLYMFKDEFDFWYVSSIEYKKSSIEYKKSSIEYEKSSIEYEKSSIEK